MDEGGGRTRRADCSRAYACHLHSQALGAKQSQGDVAYVAHCHASKLCPRSMPAMQSGTRRAQGRCEGACIFAAHHPRMTALLVRKQKSPFLLYALDYRGGLCSTYTLVPCPLVPVKKFTCIVISLLSIATLYLYLPCLRMLMPAG